MLFYDVKNDRRLDDLMDNFLRVGGVKYARWAEKDSKRHARIKFCGKKCVIDATRLQRKEYKGSVLNVYHSTGAIGEPEDKSNEAAECELEEAMSIVKEAQSLILAVDPVFVMLADERRRSRSRSHSRERRSSRSHSRRRSRSKSKRRSRSRSRCSHSRKRLRSRSHSRHRSRSKDKCKRSRSRKRSTSKEAWSRCSRSRGKHFRLKHHKRCHRRGEGRSRSRSNSRTKDMNSKKSKIYVELIVRDHDVEEKIGQGGGGNDRRKSI